MNQKQDAFLEQWEIDLTTNAARRQHAGQIDLKRVSQVEKEVSAVIRNFFTFCVFRVDDKQYRLELEERMIATVNHCGSCNPSKTWLGNHSLKSPIKESGLWLVQGLNGHEMGTEDLEVLERTIRRVEQ